MNKEVIEIINGCLSSLPFVDKIAGISKVEKFKEYKLPFELCYTKDQCTTDNSLAPSEKYSSILYWKDKGGSKLERQHACCLNEYTTDVRLMFWFNHKKFGKDECVAPIVKRNIENVLKDRRCFNDDTGDYMNISVDEVRHVSVSENIFSDYDYDKVCANKLFKDPYEYFAIDLKIRFFYSFACDEMLTIEPEIVC